ncbi:MAG: PAS domain-containing protein [Desulfomonile sp.]|nr:PAS domain-containing protein [Desulfomonile sp.]
MGNRRKLLWQLYPSYLVITFVSVAAIAWFASAAVKTLYFQSTTDDLKARAKLIEEIIKWQLDHDHAIALDKLCKELGPAIATRITLILPSGKVIADSHEDPAQMEDHSIRPEFKDAIAGNVGVAQRYSFSVHQEMMYVALPVLEKGDVAGVVRVSVPMVEVAAVLNRIYLQVAAGSIAIVVLAALVSLFISHRINKPITALKGGAQRFAEGDLEYRLEVPHTEEIAALAEAMNTMAAQLHSRFSTVTSQRNELEAVLSSMMEAVLVIDASERVLRVNQSAERLFDTPAHRMEGRSVREVIRRTDLHRFVEKALAADQTVEGDIVFRGAPDRFIQAHGTPLKDANGSRIGALVVLNDVTRLKTLENIRRDFVTNVSHELRTPITSIKGFLETLKEGAIDDPENRERFLDIILKHTNRLNMIIEDLLTLSKIEQEAERKEIHLEEANIINVLEAVSKTCKNIAEEKNIALLINCDEKLAGRINPTLLEQAVLNLVDNAIKYSDQGSIVHLDARASDGEIVIRVVDQGCGISREHLDRIFERFYRVDKARSRQAGGTGLGLAIVKHIVNAHGGRIEVRSSPGEGSTFSIHLGRPKE